MELEKTIPTRNIPYLEKKLNRLNKRAAKLGCPAVYFEDTGEITMMATGEYDIFDKPIMIEAHKVKIYGEAPIINGWSFVGTIDHDPDGNMLRSIPGEEMPAKYRTVEEKCDHCKSIRFRHHTYIVKNEGSEYKQVGRQCLRDFLGHQSPEAIARHAEWLMDLSASIEDDEGSFNRIGRDEFSFDINGYLAWVACLIETIGWLSRKRVFEEGTGTPTSGLALNALDPKAKDNDRRLRYAKPSEENWETGKKALDWCRNVLAPTITDQSNEYEYNLVQACKRDDVTHKNAGLVASVIVSWKKAMDLFEKQKAEASKFAKSKYVGKAGERITITVKILSVFPIEGLYGPTHIHRMQDKAGNVYTWFGHTGALDEEETYNMKGTVKNHELYKGVKQTILTRCKVIAATG